MILLSVQEITKQFDVDPVFEDVSFDVRPGERIGLVGPNGSGKTTLMRVLCGMDEADRGQIELHPSATIALLQQEARFPENRTLIDEVRQGLRHLYDLQRDGEQLAAELARCESQEELQRLQNRYDFVLQELHRLDAFHIEHRVEEILTGLGFVESEFDRPISQFSGGQQTRALLARLLLEAPSVMLLDEPTNHLDIAATEWLETYLSRSQQTLILVSHDRYFLDRVTNRILEVHSGRVTDYSGNFSAYWQQRAERQKVQERTFERQQEFIEKTEDFIRKNKYGQKHAQAADRVKKLERLERVDRPREIPQLPMGFPEPQRSGDWVIDATDVTVGFGQPLLDPVELQVLRGERIGILGPNGSGKTTLMRTLLGELPPLSGTVREGTKVKVAYFDQQLKCVDAEADAIDAVRPADNPAMTPANVRDILARFGIRGEMALRRVGQMSGGEKCKVALSRLAALNGNLMALDEPTNHLDLWARASLEESLKAFEGTILFVSHDRYFLDRVATRVWVLEPPMLRDYAGNYTGYVAFRQQTADAKAEKVKVAADDESPSDATTKPANREQSKPTKKKRQFPYRKVEDLEVEIANHEAKVEELQAALSDPRTHRDGEKVKRTMAEYEQSQQRLIELYAHWEEAMELN